MGLMSQRKLGEMAELGIWRIVESPAELLQQLTLSPDEKALYQTFRTDTRRRQWLAYRRLIREIISPQQFPVHYDQTSKPYLAGSDWHISVTHTDDFAGVIISHYMKVGIDMERVRPRIDRVKDKFLSETELSAIPSDKYLESLTLAWCAKEAIYKLYGSRNLDFRKNIRVNFPSDLVNAVFSCEIHTPLHQSTYRMFQEWSGDLAIVWAMEE